MFFAKFNKSCLVTYLGILFGILSMYFAFTKMAYVGNMCITYSLACLVISGVCDRFDGKFARMCKRDDQEKAFGIQLDSLADTINFLAVPIVFMLCLGMTSYYHIIGYILLAICGVSRLGYFNVNADLNESIKVYSGLPVTSTAITYPLLGLLYNCVSLDTLMLLYFILTILTSILFVVNIKITKLKGKAYIIVPILALLLVIILLVF